MGKYIELYQLALKNFGIGKNHNFYLSFGVVLLISMVASLTQTFVNLDLHQFHFFSKSLLSYDFMMPFLGNFFALFIFQYIFKKWPFKFFIGGSVLGIGVGYFLLLFFMQTPLNFIIRFFLGVFYSFVFLGFYFYQAKIYAAPHRATLFSFSILMMSIFGAFGIFLNGVAVGVQQVFGMGIVVIVLCLWGISKIDLKNKETFWVEDFLVLQEPFLKVLFRSWRLYALLFIIAISGAAFATYFPIYTEDLGLSEQGASYLFSWVQLGVLFFVPLGGILGDTYGYEKTLWGFVCLALFSMAAVFFVENILEMGVLFFIVRGCLASLFVLIISWITEENKKKNLATELSLFFIIYRFGCVCSPIGVGFFMVSYGKEGFMYWLFGGLFLTFSILTLKRWKRGQSRG